MSDSTGALEGAVRASYLVGGGDKEIDDALDERLVVGSECGAREFFLKATCDPAVEGVLQLSDAIVIQCFVRLTQTDELAFPDYDGNGMFKSLGNMQVNPNVGLLFVDLHDKPRRLRVNGTATVSRDDPLLAHTVGAQLLVRVKARAIFPNCPRYIPKLQLVEPSQYVPRAGHEAVEPAWKGFTDFKDYVHPRQPTFSGDALE